MSRHGFFGQPIRWLCGLVAIVFGYELSHRWGLRNFFLLPLVWGLAAAGIYLICRTGRGRWRLARSIGAMALIAAAIYCSYARGDRFLTQSRDAWNLLSAQVRWIASQPARLKRIVRRQADPASPAAWTSSRLVGTPAPPLPFESQATFPRLHFKNPVALTWNGSSRSWFLAEERGRVLAFDDSRETDHAIELLDVKQVIWGLAVHPHFADNGYLYLTYFDGGASILRVSRFTAENRTGRADRRSERTIIEWPMEGHEGGCLEFGPDGYLYVSVGDKGHYDYRETGQDISDLYASILRLDVNTPDDGPPYRVPADNPFVAMEGARGEIWSYGLRQVWKMSFDRATGELWAGDVGQDLWESVHLIQRGGNCGWSIYEGAHPLFPERKQGPTPIIPPVVEQSHSVMRSITGGQVYRGTKIPELRGRYLYGDYDTGTVWSIERTLEHPAATTLIADTPLRISAFAIDAAGEVLIVDHVGGQIFELVEKHPTAGELAASENFPRKLSQTGLFASTDKFEPAAGVLPYSVNSELWSDGAVKNRFLAIKGGSQIDIERIALDPSPWGWNAWRFPDGSALVKTFSLELQPGNAASRRRVETRVMVVEDLPEDPNHRYRGMNKLWHVYSYAWNDDQGDAELVEREGRNRPYQLIDLETGEITEQVWHYPSRFECMMCHTKSAGYLLGLKTAQLNRSGHLGHVGENQLDYLDRARLINLNSMDSAHVPDLAEPTDEQAALEQRTRSYLHVNCSHCHMPEGGGNSKLDLRYHVPLAAMNLVGRRPDHGDLRIAGALLVKPGDPERSLLYQRMIHLGTGRMPKVGSSVVDAAGAALIRDWILELGQQKQNLNAVSPIEVSAPRGY